jgi:hypothetical protein
MRWLLDNDPPPPKSSNHDDPPTFVDRRLPIPQRVRQRHSNWCECADWQSRCGTGHDWLGRSRGWIGGRRWQGGQRFGGRYLAAQRRTAAGSFCGAGANKRCAISKRASFRARQALSGFLGASGEALQPISNFFWLNHILCGIAIPAHITDPAVACRSGCGGRCVNLLMRR